MKTIDMLYICVGFCLLILCGCATIPPLQTTTGKPEVIINAVTKKEVSDALVNYMLTRDFHLIKMDEYSLVFGITDKSLGAALLLGSQYNPNPQYRWTYNLIDVVSGVRILATIEGVTNPESPFEQKYDISKASKAAQQTQLILEKLKEALDFNNVMKNRGKVGVKVEKRVIVYVVPGSPAELAGLKKDDVIMKVDDFELTGDNTQDLLKISGEPGVTVVFLIKRNGLELTIPVVRGNP
jgi:hypothetical protein